MGTVGRNMWRRNIPSVSTACDLHLSTVPDSTVGHVAPLFLAFYVTRTFRLSVSGVRSQARTHTCVMPLGSASVCLPAAPLCIALCCVPCASAHPPRRLHIQAKGHLHKTHTSQSQSDTVGAL